MRAPAKVLYSQWEVGGRIRVTDSSQPPVHWPPGLLAAPGSSVRIRFPAPLPQRVEIRAWRRVDERGIPRTRGQTWVCSEPATKDALCTIVQGLSGPEDSAVVLSARLFRDGARYLSITAYWEPIDLPSSSGTNMIVWILRMQQARSGRSNAGRPIERSRSPHNDA